MRFQLLTSSKITEGARLSSETLFVLFCLSYWISLSNLHFLYIFALSCTFQNYTFFSQNYTFFPQKSGKFCRKRCSFEKGVVFFSPINPSIKNIIYKLRGLVLV